MPLVIAILVFESVSIYFLVDAISRAHPREVYLIWLTHSVFFLVSCSFNYVAQSQGIGLTEVCGSQKAYCEDALEFFTSVRGELDLLAFGSAVVIAPQILTYLTAGAFGCGSPPVFVSYVQQIVVWSMVKFFVGLGGMFLGSPVATLLHWQPVSLFEFVVPLFLTTIAFGFGQIQLIIEDGSKLAREFLFKEENRKLLRALVKTNRWFTRRMPASGKPADYFMESEVTHPLLNDPVHVVTRLRGR